LIHATSLGLPSSPWDEGVPERILDHKAPRNLVDFVYSPGAKTPLIAWSHKRGIPCVTGEELLVAQGAEAFRLFTGKKLPKELRHLPADCLPKEER
jgi:shikimate dehydrogenase